MSSDGIFPAPTSLQARSPISGSMTCIPNRFNLAMLSWTIGFSYIFVFMAGEIIFLHLQAITVVVSISSAIPFAIFPITFAEAGAISTTSAFFASETCSTLNWKFLSNVSIRHLFPVSVSNVIGFIKLVAFCVINT